MMRVLDLFSGIGGFSLGLERAGMRTISFCENNSFCRRVLAQNWPEVPILEDVTTTDFPDADVICGGFPCQDISNAGAGAGLSGSRSGLWWHLLRAIRVVRPQHAIVENVAALLSNGMGSVLGYLAAIGYDAEWHCIPACAIGAEHERDRVWIIANPDSDGELQSQGGEPAQRRWAGDGIEEDASDAHPSRLPRRLQAGTDQPHAGAIESRLRSAIRTAPPLSRDYWDHQPVLGRGLHGIPDRVDRVSALGNSVVPQIPELIGRAIIADLQIDKGP